MLQSEYHSQLTHCVLKMENTVSVSERLNCRLLPRGAMHKHGASVHLSVCPSFHLMYGIKTAADIIKLFLSLSPIIKSVWHFKGNHLSGVLNKRAFRKIFSFQPLSRKQYEIDSWLLVGTQLMLVSSNGVE